MRNAFAKKKLLMVSALLTAVVFLSGCFDFSSLFPPRGGMPSDSSSSLTVVFIDVGQGDSELIICDGKAMLIDAGVSDAADDVSECLSSYGITELEYLVATHPHSDHIGGMSKVIGGVTVNNVLMPDVVHDTATFEKLLDMIEFKGLEIETPSPGDSFNLGSALCTVLAPQSGNYSDLNDYSLVIRVEFAGRSVLFTGDTGKKPQGEMLDAGFDVSADVYKVAHHGSADNNLEDWVSAVSPEYAVISCDGKSYNHPHDETLDVLTKYGVKTYRTDRDGSVTLTIDSSGNMIFKTDNASARLLSA